MARVVLPATAFARQPTGKVSKRVRDVQYLDWIRSLPCVVTGKPAEAAHVSFDAPHLGKLGRGLGAKESDRWAVPLCADEHRKQHSQNERAYWQNVGIDPCVLALALHGAYPNTGLATLIIREARR